MKTLTQDDMLRVHRPRRSAFTLVELLTVIAIIGILSALVLVGFGEVRDRVVHATCQANLRALGQATALFLTDNNYRYPGPGADGGSRPYLRIARYMDYPGKLVYGSAQGVDYVRLDNGYQVESFHTPFTSKNAYTPNSNGYVNTFVGLYGINMALTYYVGRENNMWGASIHDIAFPGRTVLAGEHYNDLYNGTAIAGHLSREPFPLSAYGLASNIGIHKYGVPRSASAARGPVNVLFCDGHVESLEMEDLVPFLTGVDATKKYIFDPQS